MEEFSALKGSRIFLFWEQIKSNLKEKVWTNRTELLQFSGQLLQAIQKCREIYLRLDEDNANTKRLELITAELNQTIYQLTHNKVMKNIFKWTESFKKIVYQVFKELSLLKELQQLSDKNYRLSDTLLNSLRESSVFIITFHRTGNERPWISDENIHYGMQWINHVVSGFQPMADSLPTNFKRLRLGIECDYTWIFREKVITNRHDKVLIQNDPRYVLGVDNKFETMHTFFTHPKSLNLITGKVQGRDIMRQRASFEVTRPEHVLRIRDPRVHIYIHLQWGVNGKSHTKEFYDQYALKYLLNLFRQYNMLHSHVQIAGSNMKYLQFVKSHDQNIPTEILSGKPFPNLNPALVVGFLNPIPQGIIHLSKSIFRISKLSIIDVHVDCSPPKDIINFRNKVIVLQKKGKQYNPQLVKIFKTEYCAKEVMLKRLLRAYLSGCVGSWVEPHNVDAVMEFPQALYQLNHKILELYQ